jgi:hypothetical protein
MKVINFLSGPCAGKSTLCAGLFHIMKKRGYNVEYVHEWAKELTWDERYRCLKDQISILGHQNNMLSRLDGKVDWVVTDTSLLLGLLYEPKDYFKGFEPLLLEVFNSYENINVFINRPYAYSEVGSIQSLEEAKLIDEDVKALMDNNNIPYLDIICEIKPDVLLSSIESYSRSNFS